MKATKWRVASLALGAAVILAACGGDDTDNGADDSTDTTGTTDDAGDDEDAAAAQQVEDPDVIGMPCTFSTSSYFAYCAGMSDDLGNELGLSINVVETGGTEDSLIQVLGGEGEIAFTNNLVMQYAAACEEPYDDFCDDSADQIRTLWWFDEAPYNIFIADDSDIEGPEDMDGVPVVPGGIGTVTEDLALEIFAVMGVEPEFVRVDGDQGLEMFQNREVDALSKAGKAPDSYVLQANESRPIRMLDFPLDALEEHAERTGTVPMEISTGDAYGEEQTYWTYASLGGIVGRADLLSHDLVYAMAERMFSEESLENIRATMPTIPDREVLLDLLNDTEVPGVPMHSGMVSYLQDEGYDVPDFQIPPEHEG